MFRLLFCSTKLRPIIFTRKSHAFRLPILKFKHIFYHRTFATQIKQSNVPSYLNWWSENKRIVNRYIKRIILFGFPFYMSLYMFATNIGVLTDFCKKSEDNAKNILFLGMILCQNAPSILISLCDNGWIEWAINHLSSNHDIIRKETTVFDDRIENEFSSLVLMERILINKELFLTNYHKNDKITLIFKINDDKNENSEILTSKFKPKDFEGKEYYEYIFEEPKKAKMLQILSQKETLNNIDTNILFLGNFVSEEDIMKQKEIDLTCAHFLITLINNPYFVKKYFVLPDPNDKDKKLPFINNDKKDENYYFKHIKNFIKEKIILKLYKPFEYEKLSVKEILNTILYKIVLQDNPEISMVGAQLLFVLSKNDKLTRLIVEMGGFDVLCRLSLAKNQRVGSFAGLPISSLIRNTRDIKSLNLSEKQKDIIIRSVIQISASLVQSGNFHDALLGLNDCITLDKDHYMVLNMLVSTYSQIGDYQQANKYLRRLIKKMPEISDFYYTLASNLYKENKSKQQLDEAISCLQDAIEIGTAQQPELLYFLLSEIYQNMGRMRDAINCLEEFCQSNEGKNLSKAHIYLGNILLKESKNDKDCIKRACAAYENAIKCQKFNSETYQKLAYCRFLLGEYKEAELACKTALKINPKSKKAIFTLGKIQKRLQNWTEMEKVYGKICESGDKVSPESYYQFGIANEKLNKENESINAFINAINSWKRICSNKKICNQWFEKHPNEKVALEKIGQRCLQENAFTDLKKFNELKNEYQQLKHLQNSFE